MSKAKKPVAVVEPVAATPTIGGAVTVVVSVLIALLKGEIFSPTMEVNGVKYLSGGSLFRKVNIVKPEDKKALRPTIDGILAGGKVEGIDDSKMAKLVSAIKTRFPDIVGVCYRPNFQWSSPKAGETKMTYGLGRDWPLFQQRWEESAKLNSGSPNPEWVAIQYGTDEYGPLMSASYATHVASEAIKHGMSITPPVRKGRGRRRDVPSIASTSLNIDAVLSELGL